MYENGMYQGALLLSLVAVAATSRERFPRGTRSRISPAQTMGDREAFTTFLLEEINVLLGLPHLGKLAAVVFRDFCTNDRENRTEGRLEHILYEYMRCSLVHSAALPPNIELRHRDSFQSHLPSDLAFKFAFPDANHLVLSYEVIPSLVNLVRCAMET